MLPRYYTTLTGASDSQPTGQCGHNIHLQALTYIAEQHGQEH